MKQLYLQNKKMIEACADKLCHKFSCEQLREDFISAGTLALLTYAEKYNPDSGAAISTFLYPYIVGAMKRELEHNLYPVSLSKREFEGLRGQSKPDFFSLNDSTDDNGESVFQLRDFRLDVEESVFLSIYFPLLKPEFEKLSFKEKQILGGFFGVYGYEKHSLSELGEEFDMTENAAAKAKDKALKKLTSACMDGEIGVWYRTRKAIRKAQKEASLSADRQACKDNVERNDA